jgi:hypothetical protein
MLVQTKAEVNIRKLFSAEDIDIKIEGPAKIDMKRKDNPDGSTNVSYLPMTPGAYLIHIKYKGSPIKGSPFSAKVSGNCNKVLVHLTVLSKWYYFNISIFDYRVS